jgi:hypothetical protein
MPTTTYDPDRQAIATAARRAATALESAADELDRVHWQHAAGVIVHPTDHATRLSDIVHDIGRAADLLREVATAHYQEQTP